MNKSMVLFMVMETSEPRVEVARFVGQVAKDNSKWSFIS